MKQYHFCQEFGNRALIWIEESFLSLPCAVLVMGKELSVWVIFLSRKQSSPIAREEWTSSRLICDGWLNANLATLFSAIQRIQNATGYSYTGTLVGSSENLATSHLSLIETTVARQLRMWIWRNFLQQDQLRMNLSLVIDSLHKSNKNINGKLFALTPQPEQQNLTFVYEGYFMGYNVYSLKSTSRYTHWSYGVGGLFCQQQNMQYIGKREMMHIEIQ